VSVSTPRRVLVVTYSPGAMVRLFSTEPSRKNGHHFCTEAMAQRRADGAAIPATVEDGHYWTKAVILHSHREPHVPASTGCPAILRSVDWAAARALAVAGGGYLDGLPPDARLPAEHRGRRVCTPSRSMRATERGGAVVSAPRLWRPRMLYYRCQIFVFVVFCP
jgi:hypothetical protein